MFTILPLLVDLFSSQKSKNDQKLQTHKELLNKLQELAQEYQAQNESLSGKVEEKLCEEIQKTFEALVLAINNETDVKLDLTQELTNLEKSVKNESDDLEIVADEATPEGPTISTRSTRSVLNLIRGTGFGVAVGIIGSNFLGQIGRRLGNEFYDSARSMADYFRDKNKKIDDGYIYFNNSHINKMNKDTAMKSLFGGPIQFDM